MKKYKAAVIGLGNVGSLFDNDRKRKGTIWTHAGAYTAIKNVELIAGADPDLQKRSYFSERWGITNAYSNSREMFNRHKIDIVSIAAPTEYHYKEAMEAVEHDVKAIFLEKPITYEVRHALEIIKACEKKNIILGINHTRRWDNNYITAKKILQSGEIGDLKAIIGSYGRRLYMAGTHQIDIMRYYAGEVEKVTGSVSTDDAVDPSVSGYLHFRDNIPGFISSPGISDLLIFETEIIGTKGIIKLIDNGTTIELYKYQKSRNYGGYREPIKQKIKLQSEKNDRFIKAISDILSCIGTKKRPACSGYDGLVVIKICKALIKSARKDSILVKI